MADLESIKFLGDYINGEFQIGSNLHDEWSTESPADKKDLILKLSSDNDNVDKAVFAAAEAYKKWRHTSLEERKELLLKLKTVYEKNKDRIAQCISRETGKPYWETLTEVAGMIGKIGITIEHSLSLVADVRVENALPGVDGVIRFKSRGVMAVVGPFNFPGHLPNGHIVPALLTGNTIVFKPSDKTPATGQLMAEMFHQAGFPVGVFNLVQGRGEVGSRLVGHNSVDGVLFTGSYQVGLKIKEATMNHYWKLLALEMGGKNVSVVWKDADIDKAVYENIIGAFISSGQRCSCTSKIVIHKDIRKKFLDKYIEVAKTLKVGHWNDNPFMGTLINDQSVENYLKFQEMAQRENAETLLRAERVKTPYQGCYVSPSINMVQKFDKDSMYQKTEIFGPNVAVIETSDFDEALEINNSTGFGLVMSLFSKEEALYKKAIIEAKVGLLNWNRTTNGASSRLPFGGMGKSGNDQPSAHFAVNYTTVPVASLEDHTSFEPDKVFPGIGYDFKK